LPTPQRRAAPAIRVLDVAEEELGQRLARAETQRGLAVHARPHQLAELEPGPAALGKGARLRPLGQGSVEVGQGARRGCARQPDTGHAEVGVRGGRVGGQRLREQGLGRIDPFVVTDRSDLGASTTRLDDGDTDVVVAVAGTNVDVRYNETTGVYPVLRLLAYPSDDRFYSFVAGKSTTKDEDYEAEYENYELLESSGDLSPSRPLVGRPDVVEFFVALGKILRGMRRIQMPMAGMAADREQVRMALREGPRRHPLAQSSLRSSAR